MSSVDNGGDPEEWAYSQCVGAILLGFPDTTQDADLFLEKTPQNCHAAAALGVLGFELSDNELGEVQKGKDFIQLENGPFDLDLSFARVDIERFADAWQRHMDIEGFSGANREESPARDTCLPSPFYSTVRGRG